MSRTQPQTAIVIGGGIAGLATAALLAEEGLSVTLLEAQKSTGGRAGVWQQDGFRFDTGPSWYLMPEVFDHFFRMLGTSAAAELDLVPLTPAYRVYGEPDPGTGATPLDIPSGREAAMAVFEEREPGSGSRLSTYLDSAEDAYSLSVGKFLYDPYATYTGLLDPELLRQLPRLASLLTRPLSTHIERQFDDPLLRQVLGYPAVFLGGSPFGVPSLYHLMSHLDLNEGVLYPRGGFTEVIAAVERLASSRGVDIRTSSPVKAITTRAAGGKPEASGVQLPDGTTLQADIVVSTADLHHTETALLPRQLQSFPEEWWQKRTPSPGALLILLGVKGELPELTHHTLLFARDWATNFDNIFGDTPTIPDPASLYICKPSATDSTVAPSGFENIFVLVPIPAEPTYGHGGVNGDGDAFIEAAADRAIKQISQWCGIPDLEDRVVVRRTIAPGDFESDLNAWRGNSLGLAHTLRQSAVFRPKNASKRVDQLFYAGASALPGIGLPMCLISAELVLKRVRGDKTAGPLVEPARTNQIEL